MGCDSGKTLMRTGGLCSTPEAKGLCGMGRVWGVEAQVLLEADDAGEGVCACAGGSTLCRW